MRRRWQTSEQKNEILRINRYFHDLERKKIKKNNNDNSVIGNESGISLGKYKKEDLDEKMTIIFIKKLRWSNITKIWILTGKFHK